VEGEEALKHRDGEGDEGLVTRVATLADFEPLVAGNIALARESEALHLDAGTVHAGVRAVLERRAPGEYWVVESAGRVVAQLLITYEWSDWRNRMVWWIQSVYVMPAERATRVFREIYAHIRRAAQAEGAGGLRLYVHTGNARAQAVYAAVGMNGEHYRVFEDMF
jgi:GNAT superfamily N-acetyltransferase